MQQTLGTKMGPNMDDPLHVLEEWNFVCSGTVIAVIVNNHSCAHKYIHSSCSPTLETTLKITT